MPSFTDPPSGGKGPIRPPLRLVHPARTPARKRRRPKHDGRVFAAEEQAKLRVALAVARDRFGGLRKLAAALDVAENTICAAIKGRAWGFSAALAVRLVRVAGVSLDDIIRPGLRLVRGVCPTCGRGGAS